MSKRTHALELSHSGRDFNTGPKTYGDIGLVSKIYTATGLEDRPEGARVLDFMAGAGKLGLTLQELFDPTHRYFFFDGSSRHLSKMPETSLRFVGDARVGQAYGGQLLPLKDESVDVVVARYAIKNLPQIEQMDTIHDLFRVIKPGGRLVIADMVSPSNPEIKYWLISQHSKKQQFEGRNIKEEGQCYIPTESEWLKLLKKAGFQAEISALHMSKVTTEDWVRGKQITPLQRVELDFALLSAPEVVKYELKIGEESTTESKKEVHITYPLIVAKGVKP